MYTPVTDYMKPVKDDFKNLLEYLNKYYEIVTIEPLIDEIKKIHKDLWIIIIWKRYLPKNLNTIIYYNDIITNLISTLHIIVHKDIKILEFLIRNSIDDFMKFLSAFIYNININDKTSIMFENAFSYSKKYNDDFLHNNLESIKSIYSNNCLFVHSSKSIITNTCDCMIEYESLYSLDEITKTINKIDNITKKFNNIICIFNLKEFKAMQISDQAIIRDFMYKADLEELIKRL